MSVEGATRPVGDSIAKINHEVAIGEDLTFQRSWWRFERAVMGGLYADHCARYGRIVWPRPLSRRLERRATDGSLEIHYERIERTGTPSMVQVSLGPTCGA